MHHLIHRTSKHTALNPVARAVAKNNLRRQIQFAQIRFYIYEDGQDAIDDAVVCKMAIGTTMEALRIQGHTEHLDYRQLKAALNVAQECLARNGRWRSIDAVTLDVAMTTVLRLQDSIPARVLQRAWESSNR